MHFQVSIPNTQSISRAVAELQQQGLENIYVIEEVHTAIIGGFTHRVIDGLADGHMELLPETIDWEAQWADFAPGYDGNHLKIGDMSIQLCAGSGFGDLSHPTTQMMCEAMQQVDLGDCIIDLGCGSGVLGCVGVKCNVKQFYMVDIDHDALNHAKENMRLNAAPIDVIYDHHVQDDWLANVDTILMNMILPNQYSVFENCPKLQEFRGQWITSGMLKTHECEYLEFMNRPVTHRIEKDNWLAFIH